MLCSIISGSVGSVAKGFFIQYKFILPESIKHSSYTYQKLFRALYGYTQNVTKSNGKTYSYHRKGVLSSHPHIRPGKNCVIIPTNAFNNLTTFFKTGKNPTHFWKMKGDWKAVFYMDEKKVSDKEAIDALERNLDGTFIENKNEEQSSILGELSLLLSNKKESKNLDQAYLNLVVNEAEKVCQNEWFKEFYAKSPKLTDFHRKLKELKQS